VTCRTARSESFLRHALIYGAGSMMLQAAGFILLPIYTRYLHPSEFGSLEIVSRVGEILSIIFLLPGIRIASQVFFKQAEDERKARLVICSSITLILVIVAAAGAVLLPATGYLAVALGIKDAFLLRLALIAALLESMTIVPLVILQARLESAFFVTVMFAQFLVKVALSVLFVVGAQWGSHGVMIASILTSGSFALFLNLRELSKGIVWPDWAHSKEILLFSLPFVSGGLGCFLLHDGDRFFLLKYAGATAVGIYTFGYKMARLVSMFSREPLQQVWAARMYDEAKRPEAASIFGTVFTRIMGSYLIVGLALCLFQDEVTSILGGPQYARAASLIAPVVLGYWFLSAADLMDSAFYIRRKTGLKSWITLASTIVTLALYAVLIPQDGARGAAIATLIGFAFNAWLTWRVSQRVFAVQYEFGRLLAMAGGASALWLFSRLLPHTPWMIPAKLLLWALWPVLMWVVGVVGQDEKAWVRSAVRRGMAHVVSLAPSLFAREIS